MSRMYLGVKGAVICAMDLFSNKIFPTLFLIYDGINDTSFFCNVAVIIIFDVTRGVKFVLLSN